MVKKVGLIMIPLLLVIFRGDVNATFEPIRLSIVKFSITSDIELTADTTVIIRLEGAEEYKNYYKKEINQIKKTNQEYFFYENFGRNFIYHIFIIQGKDKYLFKGKFLTDKESKEYTIKCTGEECQEIIDLDRINKK